MLQELKDFKKNIQLAYTITSKIRIKSSINKILYCGMGGSAIAGYIIRDLLKIPVIINQDYDLSYKIDKQTFVIIASYSGNTEETITMYNQVVNQTRNFIVITSGGKLINKKNVIKIPSGYEPKNAFAFLFMPLLRLLHDSRLINVNMENIVKSLNLVNLAYANSIANKIKGKVPVIYAPYVYNGLSLRFKQSLNESGKQLAISNVYPEIFHNEILADYDNKFKVIILEDKINKRLNYFSKITNSINIKIKGNSNLAKKFYGIYLADYVAYYLALLKHKDPDDEKRIEEIKKIKCT